MSDAARVVVAVLVLAISLAVAIPVYDAVEGSTDTFDEVTRVDDTVNIEGQTGSFVDVRAGEFGNNETVRDSRGHALRLAGTDDSFVQSDASFEFAGDQNWTVVTWARVNDSAGSKNMTAVSLDGRVLIQFNGSQGNWSVFYFDEGSRNSFRANVSAPNQPGNLTMVTAQHNGSHLMIFRNTTQGDVVNTSVDQNVADIQIDSTNWDGDIDETRTFDDNLSSSQRSTLNSDPVGPLPSANRTARLMYDAGSGNHVNIYWASTDATASNISYVDGLDGQVLTDPLIGGDYDWRDEGPEIRAKSGGEVDGAPVVFAEYDLLGSEGQTFKDVVEALELIPVLFIALIAGVVIVAVRRFR